MKVLIVEDSKGQRRLIQRVIGKRESYEVITARDAFDAYAVIRAIDIDVVILDNDMPYATGMSLLNKLRDSKDLSALKVIMISADEEYENFKSIGADECLQKPFSGQQLMTCLRAMG